MSLTEPVRVACIGCGNFAQWQHLPNLARLPNATLHAVCDQNPATAEAAATAYHADRALTDPQEVFDDPAVEAVVIAVRDEAQAGLARRALACGKHVYAEKPLVTDLESASLLRTEADEAARHGRHLVVGFQKRFAPAYRQLKTVMDADGGPRLLYARMADDAWRWAKGYPPGALLQHDVCHFFDLMRHWTGSEVASVCCFAPRPDDDAVLLQFRSGAVANLLNSGHATMDMPKERIEAITERGSVVADDFVELRTYGYPAWEPRYTFAGQSHPHRDFLHTYLFAELGITGMEAVRRMTAAMRARVASGTVVGAPDEAQQRAFAESTLPNFMRDQGWMDAMRIFLESIRAGAKPPHADAGDAWAVARVTAAVLRSRAEHRVVYLEELPC